jgi:protein involved in polysaccharide export with SLBB domain
MTRSARRVILLATAVGTVAAFAGTGCQSSPARYAAAADIQLSPDFELPKELNLTTHPPYTVAAPDILQINASRLIPLPPYRIEPLDALYLYAPGAPEKAPVNGIYPVDPDGTINMGPDYGGQVMVADLTAQQAERKLAEHLKRFLKEPATSVSLAQSKGVQQIRGEHLIRPDGTVGLGNYGSVYVAGMTLPQVKAAIEAHLSQTLLRPEVSVDVGAFNHKFYYVITDFAGNGEQVQRLPSTGSETVLDAIAQIGGLSPVSSKKMWIARPAPADSTQDQILPVDWKGISRRGHTRTNYQILPGDRVFIMSQPLAKLDTQMARSLAPIERLFGVTLLGTSTVNTIRNPNQGGLGIGGFR